MTKATRFFTAFFGMLSIALLSTKGDEMDDHMEKMKAAERSFNERQSREVVILMTLETMFPDPQVRALAEAAGDGDLRKIERLVQAGINVNARGTRDATPLFWSMRSYRGFKRLLELGADPNVVFGDGNSVILAATTLRDLRILQTVLEHGGNPNIVAGDYTGDTPLFVASRAGIQAVDILLKYGANINARNSFGSTPVLSAAKVSNFEMVFYLLERGADYRLKDKNGTDLARQVATKVGRIRPGTDFAEWHNKVIAWLQAKGVELPEIPDRRKGNAAPPRE